MVAPAFNLSTTETETGGSLHSTPQTSQGSMVRPPFKLITEVIPSRYFELGELQRSCGKRKEKQRQRNPGMPMLLTQAVEASDVAHS